MKPKRDELIDFLNPSNAFAQLSLRDLLDGRDLCHADFITDPNVVATAVGRYRIRRADSWPSQHGAGKTHGKGVRTLENSEIRPYSWPAILVFVHEWRTDAELSSSSGRALPPSICLKDGRRVPICVIEEQKESKTEVRAVDIQYPLNNIGGGNPVIAEVQGVKRAATIACLVSDGHKVYALTNRHVTGDAGEVVYARLGGKLQRIGTSSGRQLKSEKFTTLYPDFGGENILINEDIGLIEIDNLESWTAAVGERGEIMGPMVDLSVSNSMALLGCRVRGIGAASGEMAGEVQALFYRYKVAGDSEYLADLLIGPRASGARGAKAQPAPLVTHPGDSGAIWLLEPNTEAQHPAAAPKNNQQPAIQPRPLAVQWGRNLLNSAGAAQPQSYVLATFLARSCAELEVDLIRDWNLDQVDTWGAVGHYSIANRTQVALSSRLPKLVKLMTANASIISHDDDTILNGDFKGMGSQDFVALADVPDFFWKQRIAQQGFARPLEGPNHFADMDQPGPDGRTLLDLCKDDSFIDPDKWNEFYDSVTDLLSGDKISDQHRGLLPFRVWQIFDAMVDFAAAGDAQSFVCAAGVITHYIGDACQPLHISYLHDGDPLRKYEYTFKKGKHEGETEERAYGTGVHSAYEDEMVNAFSDQILEGLAQTPKTLKSELLGNGFEAAQATIAMMRKTFKALPPMDIVDAFASYDGAVKDRAAYMWKKFGKKTITSMQSGTHLLAVLWESAWSLGEGESNVGATPKLTKAKAMEICGDRKFLPSMSVGQIGAVLRRP